MILTRSSSSTPASPGWAMKFRRWLEEIHTKAEVA